MWGAEGSFADLAANVPEAVPFDRLRNQNDNENEKIEYEVLNCGGSS